MRTQNGTPECNNHIKTYVDKNGTPECKNHFKIYDVISKYMMSQNGFKKHIKTYENRKCDPSVQ